MGKLILIVAVAKNGAIGKDNNLLWKLPADLKHFKSLTIGHTIIMGRNTFDSLPNRRPLPERKHLIMSRQKDLILQENCELISGKDDLIKYLENNPEETVFVIGGGQIYSLCESLCDEAYITVVDKEFEADTFFCGLNPENWKLELSSGIESDPKSELKYEFRHYKRVSKCYEK